MISNTTQICAVHARRKWNVCSDKTAASFIVSFFKWAPRIFDRLPFATITKFGVALKCQAHHIHGIYQK